MSLGGPLYQPVNVAVDNAVKAGIAFIVAAGNDNNDACKYSPASSNLCISIAATEVYDNAGKQTDARSYFSNFGSCVDMFAPGTMITSAWIGASNTAIRTISGTSMAAPHVCGVAALFFDKNPSGTVDQLRDSLHSGSTKDTVDLECTSTVCRSTPNRFLHSNCDVSI